MATHYWNNHKIEVTAHALPKYFWCVISFSVTVNNKHQFKSSEPLGLKETLSFQVANDTEVTECELVSIPPSSLLHARYKLVANGEKVATGKTAADNWYMLYGLMALWITGVLLYASIT